MKLEAPVNENYAAVVVEVLAVNELEGLDNLRAAPLLGFQALVSKDVYPGTVGVLFPAEVQLSEEFCRQNNLFRKSELNSDKGSTGYIEENRRVRAIKLRGHRSSALFMSLESLAYTGVDISRLQVGDVFDKLGKHEICKKYMVKQKASNPTLKNKLKAESRVDERFLPLHFDTANYWRNKHLLAPNQQLVITAKLHGTSVRVGHTVVKRKLSWLERVAKRFGAKIQDHEYDYVYGSRRVIKDANNPNQNHWYEKDIWSQHGSRLKGLLPQGFVVYGELVGWTEDGVPIQPNYTYGLPQGEAELYIYRVAQVNPQGRMVDLAWDQLVEFCQEVGLKHVPELARMTAAEFEQFVDDYIDIRFHQSGFINCPPLDKEKLVDEGVCVRVDGLVPWITKAKSPLFLEHETKLLDKGTEDMESAA